MPGEQDEVAVVREHRGADPDRHRGDEAVGQRVDALPAALAGPVQPGRGLPVTGSTGTWSIAASMRRSWRSSVSVRDPASSSMCTTSVVPSTASAASSSRSRKWRPTRCPQVFRPGRGVDEDHPNSSDSARRDRLQVAAPPDSLQGEDLVPGHRLAEQPAQREVDRRALGRQVEPAHDPGDQIIIDVDVRPTHPMTLHHTVYESATACPMVSARPSCSRPACSGRSRSPWRRPPAASGG